MISKRLVAWFEIVSKIILCHVNIELRGRGLCADKLCMIKIYVKGKTFKNRSISPDSLERFVRSWFLYQVTRNITVQNTRHKCLIRNSILHCKSLDFL